MKIKPILIGAAANLALLTAPYASAESMESAGPTTFVGSYTLWIAIIIGLTASFTTFRYGANMRGSKIATILTLFGTGMFLVVLGFVSVVLPWAPAELQKIVHDLLFITGYICLLVGAYKIKTMSA